VRVQKKAQKPPCSPPAAPAGTANSNLQLRQRSGTARLILFCFYTHWLAITVVLRELCRSRRENTRERLLQQRHYFVGARREMIKLRSELRHILV
jgi:hypothetical protein